MTKAAEEKREIFTAEFRAKADKVVARYEDRRAPLLEILRLVQEEYGHITLAAEEEVAGYLGIAPVDVREVMTFYTLYYSRPRAKARFAVCQTLACSLGGCEELISYLSDKLGIRPGEQTADGQFSLTCVECLGACEIAPMMQLNDDKYYGNLTREKLDEIIEKGGKD